MFKGSTFIDNLTIDDFEVYEDGKLQKIEAVYLIKKTKIEREEEVTKKKFTPEVSRNFIFVFEIRDYFPKIGEVLDYFFNDVVYMYKNMDYTKTHFDISVNLDFS